MEAPAGPGGSTRAPVTGLGLSVPTLPVSLPCLTGRSSIHGRWLLDRPVNPPIKSGEGDDSTEAGRPNRKMPYFSLRTAVLLARRAAALVRHPAQRQPPFLMK